MAVQIKGMELPETCGDCLFGKCGHCYITGQELETELNVLGYEKKFFRRHNSCLLVDIPDGARKMGRMINADKVLYHIDEHIKIAKDKIDNSMELEEDVIEYCKVLYLAKKFIESEVKNEQEKV